MKLYNTIYARFLEHLETCGGCVGEKRKPEKCRYVLPCATAEAMAKKGMISNSKDLLVFGCNNRSNDESSVAEECVSASNARTYGSIGPCNID